MPVNRFPGTTKPVKPAPVLPASPEAQITPRSVPLGTPIPPKEVVVMDDVPEAEEVDEVVEEGEASEKPKKKRGKKRS